MTDPLDLTLDFDKNGVWLIDNAYYGVPMQLGHVSWAVIARHIHPHLEYYDVKKKVMKNE